MGAMKFGQIAEAQSASPTAREVRFLRRDVFVRYLPLVVMLVVLIYMALTVEHFMTERQPHQHLASGFCARSHGGRDDGGADYGRH